MTILLVQTFLLMLGAFLLGASLSCLIRRGVSGGREASAGTTASSLTTAAASGAAPAADTDRFGRALSGGNGPSVPPVFQPGQPVVEVQPRPAQVSEPAPASEPIARAPVPQPEPPPAPPQRDVLPPQSFEPEPQPSVEEPPAPVPEPEAPAAAEPSYTQVAVAAAAAAATLKAKADAEAAEAARIAAEAEEAAQPEPEPPAPGEAAGSEASYTEIAVAAAAAVAALAGSDEVEEAPAEAASAVESASELEVAYDPDAPTRFGTPVARTALEPTDAEPVDDLTRIHGIDVELKERLVRYGIHRFSQIAAWTADDVRAVNQTLGFQGRIEDENWVEQAAILAAGGDPGPAQKAALATPADTAVPIDGDRLHRIIGIDPQSEAFLRANGVTQLEQIAAWTAEDVARFDALLGVAGRITREGWVEQALFLTGRAPPAPEVPVEEAVTVPEPGPEVEAAPEPSVSDAPRSESYAALRSVRSEALRGDGIGAVTAGAVDDLKRIRGIGVLIEKKLNSLGITAYEQVANWTRADIDRISELLDFKGRIERENWIEQARILASGGQTEFSRRVDRGDA